MLGLLGPPRKECFFRVGEVVWLQDIWMSVRTPRA